MSRRFSKILVANRGEIACRIFRTAKEKGYATVAVYSDADADALHVAQADEAVRIGPPTPTESYLNMDAILEAAKRTGADAIHPGYGFLAENGDFAQACADAGITFIGPPPKAMADMGNKAAAKRLMAQADVPCVPGYDGESQDVAVLKAEAERIGFPLLVKAAAGGGGRGMRRVDSSDELDQAIAGAKSEAEKAFGSGELILEKLVEHGRHVEIQILADEHGTCIHLGERDCSVQRRHQKIIEESPCPIMTPELREKMGQAAVSAAQAVDYVNAGTVEFLLDADGSFYFLEMNTRLQVEHPVTEYVTGLDLVAMQLGIAQGQPLPENMHFDAPQGHGVEVRLYAEDPDNGFMPQTGTVVLWSPPDTVADHVRADHGLQSGDIISPYYDPMVAKIITHGATRDDALDAMVSALNETCLFGVTTNRELLLRILADTIFREGSATTDYLESSGLLDVEKSAPDMERQLVAAAVYIERDSASVPASLKGWRSTGMSHVPLRLEHDDEIIALQVTMHGDTYTLAQEDNEVTVVITNVTQHSVSWVSHDHHQHAQFAFDDTTLHIQYNGRLDTFNDVTYAPAEVKGAASDGRIKSPMAGLVVAVQAAPGDVVSKGDVLLIIEAMKMENRIVAPCDGTIVTVDVTEEQQVDPNQLLLQIEVTERENDE